MCRFGGEEFLVLRSEHCPQASSALDTAENIRQAVAALAIPHQPAQEGKVTLSIGVCTGPFDPEVELNSLIKAADVALYAAKREGRNRVRYGAPSDALSNLDYPVDATPPVADC